MSLLEERDLADRLADVGALAHPRRLSLYLYVTAQSHEVSREEAATATGVSRAVAGFHLDKLVAGRLLEAGFRRVSGRRGPGAGRPAKLYRRSARQHEVTLPPRNYELAARLLAQAVDEAGDGRAKSLLSRVGRRFGEDLGGRVRSGLGRRSSGATKLAALSGALERYGYEPHQRRGALAPTQLSLPLPGPEPPRPGVRYEPRRPGRGGGRDWSGGPAGAGRSEARTVLCDGGGGHVGGARGRCRMKMPAKPWSEDRLMTRFVGKGSRHGSSWFGKAGDVAQQPPVWAGVAMVLALGGPRGRRAALRGSICYGAAALAQIAIKPIAGRSRPKGSGWLRIGPVTSSFPSGHAATDLAFNLGAAQELPLLFIPLSAATLAAHWSIVRSRGHYLTDVLGGGALGIVVAMAAWWLWPPGGEEAAKPAPATEDADRQSEGSWCA